MPSLEEWKMKMKKVNRLMLVSVGLCLLPMVLSAVLYSRLPEQIPVHWNMEGEIDGYAPKFQTAFGMPLLLAALQGIACFSLENDPRKAGIGRLRVIFYWVIPVVSWVVIPSSLLTALGVPVDVSSIVTILVGVLFIIVGNYLPKCRLNYTVGVKLPWTLNSEENWRRTHRVTGYLWIAVGLVWALCGGLGFADNGSVTLFLVGTLGLAVGIPFLYSYCLFRRGI